MKTLSAADKHHFSEESNRPAPRGFVCVGFGGYENESLEEYFGENRIYSRGSGQNTTSDTDFGNNYAGTANDCLYYVRDTVWKSIVGKVVPSVSAEYTIPEQITYANNLVGKQVKIDGRRVTVSEIQYLNTTKDFIQDDYTKKANTIIQKQGIVLGFYEEDGSMNFIHPVIFPMEIAPKVVVNGETAVDKGDYYQFGCANITKSQLVAARNFLTGEAAGTVKNNRTIDAVVIGKGSFTLETLNDLL